MAVNLWARWKDLTASDPLLVADVVGVDTVGGRSLVQFPGGSQTWIMGVGTVEGRVFVQGGRVIGDAPVLALVIEEV